MTIEPNTRTPDTVTDLPDAEAKERELFNIFYENTSLVLSTELKWSYD